MSLTGKEIVEIARLLDASHFTSLDLEQGGFRLRISREEGGGSWRNDARSDADGDLEEDEAEVEAASAPPAPASAAPGNAPGAGEIDIPAPLIGNFYAAPRPGEPPFVQVGDRVGKDTVIGIIEVMKLMNSVAAGVDGVVTAMLAENGSSVEEGQALIRVKVD